MHPKAAVICAAAVLCGLMLAAPTPPPAIAAPDQTQGVALLSATVAANGNLVRGSGAVSSTRAAIGTYTVAFERPIDACVAVGNVSQTRGVEFPGPVPGSVSVAFVGPQNQAAVLVTDPDGPPDDLAFQLLVFCAE